MAKGRLPAGLGSALAAVYALPFQATATGTRDELFLKKSPTATQYAVDAQDTPSSSPAGQPLGRLTAVLRHRAPFQIIAIGRLGAPSDADRMWPSPAVARMDGQQLASGGAVSLAVR